MLNKMLRYCLAAAFFINSVMAPACARAQAAAMLPAAGVRLELGEVYAPPMLKGIKLYPQDPFRFDFILDKGNSRSQDEELKGEAVRLMKYFLAGLTVPEKDLWVNLSPFEKDRIVPEAFGQTEMGRDLLAQDYILKQISASVIYPGDKVGKDFWDRVYAEVQRRYGTTDIPLDTFNKVWIVPDKAQIYENESGKTAYVVEAHLKVMLETDYVATEEAVVRENKAGRVTAAQELANQVLREVVIPVLEKEVNESERFVQLRQVYHALLLASWFKKRAGSGFMGAAYIDQNKVNGIQTGDLRQKDKIYAQYLNAFRQGAYHFIREERDPKSGDYLPRRYFSGGITLHGDFSMISKVPLSADTKSLKLVGAYLKPTRGKGPLDSRYGVFRQWFEKYFVEGYDGYDNPWAEAEASFGLHVNGIEQWQVYSKVFFLLKDNPWLAYQMLACPPDKLAELVRLLDGLVQGAGRKLSLVHRRVLEQTVNAVLYRLAHRMPAEADAVMAEVKDKIRAALALSEEKINLHAYHVASTHAVKSFIHSLGLRPGQVNIFYDYEVDARMAAQVFAGYSIEEVPSNKAGRIYVGFRNGGSDNVLMESYGPSLSLRLDPFKYGLLTLPNGDAKAMRQAMRIAADRKVIVVGSPEDNEQRAFMNTYRELFQHLPPEQRPLVIYAFREIDLTGTATFEHHFPGQKVLVRHKAEPLLPDMSGHNFLVLNTMGELARFYAVADAAFVGQDRNILEPAVHGVPVLYSDVRWPSNFRAKERMVDARAAEVFCAGNLARILKNPHVAQEMGLKGKVVVESFKHEISFQSELAAVYLIGVKPRLRDHFLNSLQDMAHQVTVDLAQRAVPEYEENAQTEYDRLTAWLEVLKSGEDTSEVFPALKLKEIFNREFGNVEAIRYRRVMVMMQDDPLRAYKMAQWPEDKLGELFNIFDYLTRGADVVTPYVEENPLRNLLKDILMSLPADMLDEPDALLAMIKERVRVGVQSSSFRLMFGVYHVASMQAAIAFTRAAGLRNDQLSIYPYREISQEMIRRFFPGSTVLENVAGLLPADAARLEFYTNTDGYLSRYYGYLAANLLLTPYKYGLEQPSSADVQEIVEIRKVLGLTDGRKAIVVGSPEDSEFAQFMKVYNKLYKELSVEQRPLLIVAFRDIYKEKRILNNSYFKGHLLHVRKSSGEPWPDMRSKNVLVLNTMGELTKVYGVGDVAFVGYDHNLLEPASAAVPVLCSAGKWEYNKKSYARMVDSGAAVMFGKDNLVKILSDPDYAREMGRQGRGVVNVFQREIDRSTTEVVLNIIGAHEQSRSKLLAALREMVSFADSAQVTVGSYGGIDMTQAGSVYPQKHLTAEMAHVAPAITDHSGLQYGLTPLILRLEPLGQLSEFLGRSSLR